MKQAAKPPYATEFKESAVQLAMEGDKSIAQTARELGVNENTLNTGINQYHRKPASTSKAVNPQHLYDELKELRKENKRLKEERDLLKKAAAYFARESE